MTNQVPANVTKDMAESILIQYQQQYKAELDITSAGLELFILLFLVNNHLKIVEN